MQPWRLPRQLPDVHPATPMGRLLAAIDEVAGEAESAAGHATTHADDLRALFRGINRLEAVAAVTIGRFDRAREFEGENHWSTTSWLRHECGLSAAAARNRVEIAQRLPELATTWDSFQRGDIGIQNAAGAAYLVADVGAEPAAKVDELLATTAADFAPERFRRVVAHVRHCVDPDGAVVDANALHERRRLHMSQTLDGMFVLSGLLDAEGGACVRTALEAVMPGRREHDRTPAQRRADALVELARRNLDAGTLETNHGQRPHLTVTVPAATLMGTPGAPGAELAWAGVVSGETARRLACDASITSIHVDAQGAPLDLGSTAPVIPVRVWRALVLRDRGCRFPGCDVPASWTDGHHIEHRAHGGRTAVGNLALLCRRHHRKVHEGGWRIVRNRHAGFDVLPP